MRGLHDLTCFPRLTEEISMAFDGPEAFLPRLSRLPGQEHGGIYHTGPDAEYKISEEGK